MSEFFGWLGLHWLALVVGGCLLLVFFGVWGLCAAAGREERRMERESRRRWEEQQREAAEKNLRRACFSVLATLGADDDED